MRNFLKHRHTNTLVFSLVLLAPAALLILLVSSLDASSSESFSRNLEGSYQQVIKSQDVGSTEAEESVDAVSKSELNTPLTADPSTSLSRPSPEEPQGAPANYVDPPPLCGSLYNITNPAWDKPYRDFQATIDRYQTNVIPERFDFLGPWQTPVLQSRHLR
jgi:hypothetical protein